MEDPLLDGGQQDPYLTSLDEEGVSTWLSQLGFPWYDQQIKEHGITGEILVHLDHEALKDVGIHSVGQRLAILKAVYSLKVAQNIPVEEGHYVPPYHGTATRTSLPSRREYKKVRNQSKQSTSALPLRHLAYTYSPQPILQQTVRPTVRSPTTALFPHPLSNHSTLSRNNSTSAASGSRPRPSDIPTLSHHLPDSPRSPALDSPRMPQDLDPDSSSATTLPAGTKPAGYSLHPSASGGEFTTGALTPTTPTGPVSNDPTAPNSNGNGHHLLSSSTGSTNGVSGSVVLASSTASSSTLGHSGGRSAERSERQGASSSSSDNPYRSFRVTLEDPCYKVLPAALKKYKINDDWRQYALFICYGNTERCLAYDEKPLMLFQRLKENNANPVFMLRHIKDIKSPITVASAKHALRRDRRPPNAGAGLDRPPVTDRQGAAMATARPTRLHHPPVLLPLGRDTQGEGEGDDGWEKPPASPREAPGYCISIYPYLAEREDEFDVAVAFVIISKTKGWWVVHRDLGPSQSPSHSEHQLVTRKSAWVPAGCLLETSVPPLSLPGASSAIRGADGNASNVPIEPAYIVSVSTPGVALMDYTKNGSDELDVRKGAVLRILKRYNHWSYAIKEDGQRGWIPSWFCGRVSREGTQPTTPTTLSSSLRNGGVPAIRGAEDDERGLPGLPDPSSG
ncbi:protein STE50, partial [Phenoliferia sp. Uapishka_3]